MSRHFKFLRPAEAFQVQRVDTEGAIDLKATLFLLLKGQGDRLLQGVPCQVAAAR